MSNDKIENNQIAELLIKKYSLLKEEVFLQIGYGKSHIRNFQIYLTLLLTIFGFIITKSELLPNKQNWYLWCIFVGLLPIISSYLILDICQAYYSLNLLGERMKTIEDKLNNIFNVKLLVWETLISNKFNFSLKPIHGVINPQWFLVVVSFLIVTLFTIIFPIILYIFIWIYTSPDHPILEYIAIIFGFLIIVVLSIINITTWLNMSKSRKYIRNYFLKITKS